MSDEEVSDLHADEPRYVSPTRIDPSALRQALFGLELLGDDPYLRMQAVNLGMVDVFLADLEVTVLRKHLEEESSYLAEAAFLSAQSQMWIFAAYELLRTWRQRSADHQMARKRRSRTELKEAR